MKYFITLFFLGFFFSTSAQWSPQTAARIAAYDSAAIKYYNGHFDNDAREAVYDLKDSLYQFFEDSATVSDLQEIVNNRNYSGFLYRALNVLHKKGFSKIELFKKYINNTVGFEYRSYGCMVISPTDYPHSTQVGAFMRDKEYTEVERDSFYRILFNTSIKHERLQYLELSEMENNPKYLDLVADFARKDSSYMSIIPLIKYRFEEEEELILEILEHHLFNPKYNGYSLIHSDLISRFSEIFEVKANDEAIFNLLVRYWKERPNGAFLKEIIQLISKRKNKIALEILYEVHEEFKKSKYNAIQFPRGSHYRFDKFCDFLVKHPTPLYYDLYYQIFLDRRLEFHVDSYRRLIDYLKKNDNQRYCKTTINYHLSIKDSVNSNGDYSYFFNLSQAIIAIKDSTNNTRTLMLFLSAKNDFTLRSTLTATDKLLKKLSQHDKKAILNEVEKVMKKNKNRVVKMDALNILCKYSNKEKQGEVLDWYGKNQSTIKATEFITSKYKTYIKNKTIEDTKLYLATKNVIGLDKIIDSLGNRPYSAVEYEVRGLIKNELDTVFNEVYYKMIKRKWRNDEIVGFVSEQDIERLKKIMKYRLKNGSDYEKREIISYMVEMLVIESSNVKFDVSFELWDLLENSLLKQRYSSLSQIFVILSFDKSQKEKLSNFYRKHFDKLTDKPFLQIFLVKNGIILPEKYMIDNCINIHQFDFDRDYVLIREFYFYNITTDVISDNMKRFLKQTDFFEARDVLLYGWKYLARHPNNNLNISDELWGIIDNQSDDDKNFALAIALLSYDKKEKERLWALCSKNKKRLKTHNDYFLVRYYLIKNGLLTDDY